MQNLNVFKSGYLPWMYIGNWGRNISSFFKRFKWAWQRVTRGFCDDDIWDLDKYYNTLFIKTLEQFRASNIGHPADMTSEEWDAYLSAMIEHFYRADKIDRALVNEYDDIVLDDDFKMKHGTPEEKNIVDKWIAREAEICEIKDKERKIAFEMLCEKMDGLWI